MFEAARLQQFNDWVFDALQGPSVLTGLEGAWAPLWALEGPSLNCKDTRSDKDGSSFLARVVSLWKPKEGLGDKTGNWKEAMTKCIKKKSHLLNHVYGCRLETITWCG